MALDAVFPAASELVMLYAGALAAGAFSGERVVLFGHHVADRGWAFVVMVLAGTIGYTLGGLVGWLVGRDGGRPFLERHGRWFHLGPAQLDRADRWFDRYGDATAFVGRITPVARSFVSIPAGVFRMPAGRYAAFTFAGSTIWCLAFAAAGFALGSSWERFDNAFRYVEIAILALVVAGVAYLLVRRRSKAPGEPVARD